MGKEINERDEQMKILKNDGKNIDFNEKLSNLEQRLQLSESNLKKSHLCIQGFAKENRKLSLKLEQFQSKQSSIDNIERSRLINSGIDAATNEFKLCLDVYRGRYDKLREVLKSRSKVVDMLKHRLEEITQFLAQLLENGDDTLNMS